MNGLIRVGVILVLGGLPLGLACSSSDGGDDAAAGAGGSATGGSNAGGTGGGNAAGAAGNGAGGQYSGTPGAPCADEAYSACSGDVILWCEPTDGGLMWVEHRDCAADVMQCVPNPPDIWDVSCS